MKGPPSWSQLYIDDEPCEQFDDFVQKSKPKEIVSLFKLTNPNCGP